MKVSATQYNQRFTLIFLIGLSLIVFFLNGAQAALPLIDIKAMGSDGPVTMSADNPLSLTIALNAGEKSGQEADWWIVSLSGDQIHSLVVTEKGLSWEPDLNKTVAMPLLTFSPVQIPAPPLSGEQTHIVFAVDDNADGIPDATWLDMVTILWNLYDEPSVADITLKSNTLKVLQSDFQNQLLSDQKDLESGIYRFKALPNTLNGVQSGTVVLFENYDVVKVQSVTMDPIAGDFLIQAEPAAITDLIQDGVISWKKKITAGASPLSIQSFSGRRVAYDPLSNTITHSGMVNGIQLDMSLQHNPGGTTLKLKSSMAGASNTPVFSASVDALLHDFNTRGDMVIQNGQMVSREFILEDVTVDMTLAFGGKESLGLDKKITLPAELKIPIMINGIPLWIGIGGALEFQSQASVETSVIFKADVHITGDFGLREDDSGYTLLTGSKNKVTVNTTENDSVAMNGQIDLGVVYEFPRISLGMGVSLLSASVYATAKTEIISRYTQEFTSVGSIPIPCDPKYSGELNAEFAVGAKASVLKLIKLSDEEQIFYHTEELWKIDGGC